MKLRVVGILGALLLVAAAPAQAQVQKIAGDVVKLDEHVLEIKAAGGRLLEIKFADDVRLSVRSSADMAKLSPGAFIGAAAVLQPDGTLLAREVHIFPESMRGRGEGHRPEANEPRNSMTNATIANVATVEATTGNTLTNATVADVTGGSGSRRLTLTYKGGEKTLVVPAGVPVMMFEPADRSLLVPGAHVIVYGATQADGKLAAERVTIGKNGFVPPL